MSEVNNEKFVFQKVGKIVAADFEEKTITIGWENADKVLIGSEYLYKKVPTGRQVYCGME